MKRLNIPVAPGEASPDEWEWSNLIANPSGEQVHVLASSLVKHPKRKQ